MNDSGRQAPGSEVLSGAINGPDAMTIVVTKLPVDSRFAKIVQVMEHAEAQRPRLRRIADRLGGWYTLFALANGRVVFAVKGVEKRSVVSIQPA